MYSHNMVGSNDIARSKAFYDALFQKEGRADDKGDHYVVSGRWQWGSGSANCAHSGVAMAPRAIRGMVRRAGMPPGWKRRQQCTAGWQLSQPV